MRRHAVGGVAALVFVAWAGFASANPGTTGYSGKPYNDEVVTCTNCHTPTGAVPTLNVTLPSALKAGEKGDVTVVVNGGNRPRTSFNAAFSDGVKATKGTNTEVPFPVEAPGEVGAVTPPPDNPGTYRFSFIAPNRNGAITLWIAGMASGGGSGGDNVAFTKRTIMISGATSSPTLDAGTTSSGATSTSSGASGTSTSSSGGSSSSSSSGDEPEPEDSAGASRRRASSADEGSSCAMGRGAPKTSRANVFGLFGLFGLASLARRRDRERARRARRTQAE